MQVHKRYLAFAAFVLAVPTGVMAGHCGGHAVHDGSSEQIVLAQYQGTSAPGMSDQRSSGAQLLGNYCSQCHGLPDPGQHGARAWSQVVARMYGHMREFAREGAAIETPNAQELSMIIAYLQSSADTD
jgi:hypothetical protein